MWIMGRLPTGHVYASVSIDHKDKTKIAIRTRSELDAQRVVDALGLQIGLQPYEITPTPQADYGWRVVVEPADYQRLLNLMCHQIDYERFKPTIPKDEEWRYEAYLECWHDLLRLTAGDHDKELA